MKKELVSVIIPVYNAESFLERALLSVLNQTYNDLEIILVDDGSKDNSPAMCDDFAKKDKRVKVIHQENAGPSAARNKGIEVAKGKYIEFLDADDYISANCIEKMVESIGASDLVVCGYHYVTQSGAVQYAFEKKEVLNFRNNCSKFFDMVKKVLFNSPCNKLLKKDLITKGFDEKYFIGEDTIFNTEYFKNCQMVTIIPDVLYYYDFTNQTSILHTKIRSEEDFKQYWDTLYNFCDEYFNNEDYLFYINGLYIKASMSQIISTAIKQNLSFKEYKQLFKQYRNTEKIKKSFKKYNKNVFASKNLFGKIAILFFKFKFKFLFYFVLKFYKKEKFKTK